MVWVNHISNSCSCQTSSHKTVDGMLSKVIRNTAPATSPPFGSPATSSWSPSEVGVERGATDQEDLPGGGADVQRDVPQP